MTTRGRYNAMFYYREGRKKGYTLAKRELYNVIPVIVDKHMEQMYREILDYRLSWVRK
jgi:hypothetical protein